MQDFSRFFLSDFRENLDVSTSFSKTSVIKFHENLFSGTGVVTREKTAQQIRIFVIFPNGRAKNGKLSLRNKILQSPHTQNVYF